MSYVWINPVTASMYEPKSLETFLNVHGYKRLFTSSKWPGVVKEKYKTAVELSKATVMDMRCPKIKELLDEYNLGETDQIEIPDIHPILIHCGIEAAQREDILREEKIITTPCQVLADLGNELGLPKTRFVSWRVFLKELGEEPKEIQLKASPIPPGFFEELRVHTVSLSGEEELRKYFENFRSDGVQLVEMLYCKNGCHNGDGILGCGKKECKS